jgi:uncharacterized membrane protein YcaP (DUF421 family)
LEVRADELPPTPRIERRLGAKGRLVGGLALLLALPVLGMAGWLGPNASERVLRVCLVYAVLLLIFRVIGKRELSRLSPFELVTLMLVPEVLSNAIQAEGSVLEALTGLCMLFVLVLATSTLAHRFEGFEKVVEARSTLLIDHGRILEDALNAERIVPDELISEMRKNGIASVSEVRWAVLESGGSITFVPKPKTGSPVTDELERE